MKKLGTILIISAIVIAVSPYVAFTTYNNIEYPMIEERDFDALDEAIRQAARNRTTFMATFALGMIPSFLCCLVEYGHLPFTENQNYNTTSMICDYFCI